MKTMLIVMSLLTATAASAADYKQVFLVGGKQVTSQDAILAAIRGEEALKCQTVEAKVSKSGTSIGLRNVKKPKAE